uniref:Uncharacterized protein n=1 Tax=uncultured Candidatus Melainabacteria bacterium TaxID=2682970 RepID=A0A650EL45_9BACT|nr:hypothetical protein Melaina855_2250 [uncultured Candidatus Melainabacteria bacterium]
MKKFLSLILSVLFVFQFTMLSGFAATTKVKAGTPVTVVVKTPHNSKTLTQGSMIEAEIAKDVTVNDILVFKAGDRATLNVTNVKKAGFVGIPGEITITNGEVFDANGTGHYINFTQGITGIEKTWPKVCLGCGIFIILAPIALFGFVKGGQAEVKTHIPLETRTSQEFDFSPSL